MKSLFCHVAKCFSGKDQRIRSTTGMEILFYSSLIATVMYVTVSLLTNREDFNMDRMLHRGRYERQRSNSEIIKPIRKGFIWSKVIGIDENYSKPDKWIAGLLFVWGMGWFVIFIVGTIWNLLAPWPNSAWIAFWHVSAIGLPVFLSLVTTVWFTWGGIKDIRDLFHRLNQEKTNAFDNGMVVNHQNLDETTPNLPNQTSICRDSK